MDDAKPRTLWAFGGLACGILGCCGLVAFGLLGYLSNDTTGVTLGLWIACLVFPSSVLCLLGVIFGLVALLRIRSGQHGGRGVALTGIVLGCLPLALVWFLLVGSNPLRW
jgi:hypothetical protein